MSSFAGESVGSTDVLVKYTYYGDANLNGVVTGSDYALTDNGLNFGLSGWSNGDYNYDGVTNGADYALLDNSFNFQGGPLSDGELVSLALHISQAAVTTPTANSADAILATYLANLQAGQSSATALLANDALSWTLFSKKRLR